MPISQEKFGTVRFNFANSAARWLSG